jgi:tetratricopeptide (TPR) repeat protein
MKSILKYASAACLLIISACNQQPKTDTHTASKSGDSFEEQVRKERIKHEEKVYAEAMKAGDIYTALHSSYSLLVDDTANTVKHLDTIVTLYVKLQLAEPALKIADRILAINPNDEKMLDLKASGDLGLGKTDEVIKKYRAQYDETKDLKSLFKLAQVYIQVGETKKLKSAIKEFEAHPDFATAELDLPSNVGLATQKVPAAAAVLYLKALDAAMGRNLTLAKKYVNEALAKKSDFFLAKQILEGLNQQGPPPSR